MKILLKLLLLVIDQKKENFQIRNTWSPIFFLNKSESTWLAGHNCCTFMKILLKLFFNKSKERELSCQVCPPQDIVQLPRDHAL